MLPSAGHAGRWPAVRRCGACFAYHVGRLDLGCVSVPRTGGRQHAALCSLAASRPRARDSPSSFSRAAGGDVVALCASAAIVSSFFLFCFGLIVLVVFFLSFAQEAGNRVQRTQKKKNGRAGALARPGAAVSFLVPLRVFVCFPGRAAEHDAPRRPSHGDVSRARSLGRASSPPPFVHRSTCARACARHSCEGRSTPRRPQRRDDGRRWAPSRVTLRAERNRKRASEEEVGVAGGGVARRTPTGKAHSPASCGAHQGQNGACADGSSFASGQMVVVSGEELVAMHGMG